MIEFDDGNGENPSDDDDDDNDERSKSSNRRRRTEILAYSCSTCNQSFEKKKNYAQHIKFAHLPDGSEVFSCELCNNDDENIFVTEMELKLHNAIKHADKEGQPGFKCPECPKFFTTKTLLTRHFGLHLQDKPFVSEFLLL